MSTEEYGKENCIRCRQCQKKVLVLVLKDLDKNSKEEQVRECLMDLVIKPNPDLRSGQLVSFEEEVHEVYDDGLLAPIKVVVEVPPNVIQKYKQKKSGTWCFGKSKKGDFCSYYRIFFLLYPDIFKRPGGCLDFDKENTNDINILQDIDLNVKFVIDNDSMKEEIDENAETDDKKGRCRTQCKPTCRADCKNHNNT